MRAFEPSPRASVVLAPLTILALVLAGCSSQPTAPASARIVASALGATSGGAGGLAGGSPNPNLFYPLELGNHWGYDHALALYTIPPGGPPGPVFGIEDRHERDILCIESRSEQSYFIESTSFESGVAYWVRYRQDASGLFEADISVAEPPACAGVSSRTLDTEAIAAWRGDAAWAKVEAKLAERERDAYRAAWEKVRERATAVRVALGLEAGTVPRTAGIEPGEITRLEYALHPGAHWVIRGDPLFEATVEAEDALDLAAGQVSGWRIRIDTEFLGPSDHIHFWFGRQGFLKFVAHFELDATDPDGNVGRVIADESEVLTDLALNGGRFVGH